jgi:hypothetical protein
MFVEFEAIFLYAVGVPWTTTQLPSDTHTWDPLHQVFLTLLEASVFDVGMFLTLLDA